MENMEESELNSEKICKIQKKSKLISEKIWKMQNTIWNTIVIRYGQYGRKAS